MTYNTIIYTYIGTHNKIIVMGITTINNIVGLEQIYVYQNIHIDDIDSFQRIIPVSRYDYMKILSLN